VTITRTGLINEASNCKFSSFCLWTLWTRIFFSSARGSCLNVFALALFTLSHHRLSSTHTFLFCLYSLCERAPRADSIQFMLLFVSMRRGFSFDQRDKIIVAASGFYIWINLFFVVIFPVPITWLAKISFRKILHRKLIKTVKKEDQQPFFVPLDVWNERSCLENYNLYDGLCFIVVYLS